MQGVVPIASPTAAQQQQLEEEVIQNKPTPLSPRSRAFTKISAMSSKSKVTTLIEQSSKTYLENKLFEHINQGNVDLVQNRPRDNIKISLRPDVDLIDDNESAISELDKIEVPGDLDQAHPAAPFSAMAPLDRPSGGLSIASNPLRLDSPHKLTMHKPHQSMRDIYSIDPTNEANRGAPDSQLVFSKGLFHPYSTKGGSLAPRHPLLGSQKPAVMDQDDET